MVVLDLNLSTLEVKEGRSIMLAEGIPTEEENPSRMPSGCDFIGSQRT